MTDLAKPARIVNEAYLAWIRGLPCVVCGTNSDITVHHLQTVGARGPDYFSLPVCPLHHRYLQDKHWERLSGLEMQDLWHAVALSLMRWILREEGR